MFCSYIVKSVKSLCVLYSGKIYSLKNTRSGDASATLNKITHDGHFPFVFIRVYSCRSWL
ncbi:MAG TPA: hypothetical protein PLA12_05700 [Candidatus Hydrogenedens sp.]|nr:hypothetical protein [Candidatus Hydrogenedens sp.]